MTEAGGELPLYDRTARKAHQWTMVVLVAAGLILQGVAGRALILTAVAALVALTVIAVRAWSRRRVEALRIDGRGRFWSALGESPDGRPSLVVFSTPSCTVCRTAQHPAIEAVAGRFGPALRILKVDLSTRPAVGPAFKV